MNDSETLNKPLFCRLEASNSGTPFYFINLQVDRSLLIRRLLHKFIETHS